MFSRYDVKFVSVVVLLILITACICPADTIFVDANATGANDGSSWTDAFNYLQDALIETKFNLDVNEIWVAKGTYRPDQSSVYPEGTGNQNDTFQLINNVVINGGYAGFGNADPNERDFLFYKSVLSGHLESYGNSHTVVTGSNTNITAVLDGFTITGGNASKWPNIRGGGFFNRGGSPTIKNCTTVRNYASNGAGMANLENSNPHIINCTFINNESTGQGGGIVNVYNSNPLIQNCTFMNNVTTTTGGHTGGAISNIQNSSPRISGCVFISNFSNSRAGAISSVSKGSYTKILNCIFIDNSAASNGGALYCSGGGFLEIVNCTLVGNSARFGGGLYNAWGGAHSLIENCIFWRNISEDISTEVSQIRANNISDITIDYSCVEGWTGNLGGIGNFSVDPCFVTPGYWNPNGIPSDAYENFWVDGDYHLKPQSLCIDAGNPNYVAEVNETDLDGNQRIINEIIDIGAYEYFFNTAPVADGGVDQVRYVWLDGIAEVVLDGNDSYDQDGDQLSYSWSWVVDSNVYEVNGVSPTIEFPIGQHEIELVVNDGMEDSEPSYVIVEVIGPVDLLIDLIDDIERMELPQGIENSLVVKLDSVLQKLEDDNEKNDGAAINSLEAFINYVEAMRGKKISEEVADDLIEAVQLIIDTR